MGFRFCSGQQQFAGCLWCWCGRGKQMPDAVHSQKHKSCSPLRRMVVRNIWSRPKHESVVNPAWICVFIQQLYLQGKENLVWIISAQLCPFYSVFPLLYNFKNCVLTLSLIVWMIWLMFSTFHIWPELWCLQITPLRGCEWWSLMLVFGEYLSW